MVFFRRDVVDVVVNFPLIFMDYASTRKMS